MFTLSHVQASTLIDAYRAERSNACVSLDLGLTDAQVNLSVAGADFPDGQSLTWDDLKKILKNDAACYFVENSSMEKIHFFSSALKRQYSLRPTHGAPTMLVASFPMHRMKDVDPREDTLRKIAAVAPVIGTVLDTATGLGYTAIEAAKTATQVTTVELDPTALKVARYNPWSAGLFDNPKIRQVIGNSFEVIQGFRAEEFTRIIHDPPTFRLAGELYSGEFYAELFRVLHRSGILFHYIGDLESHAGGSVARGAIRRLREAGFERVVKHQEAFGLVATKHKKLR